MAKKILIADDEPNIIRMVECRLKNQGYEVKTAADGARTLSMIAEEIPDLMILDLMMPSPDGYQVCRMLKEDRRFDKIPIIILTAKSTDTEDRLKQDIRADACLYKPYEPEILISLVEKMLAEKKPHRG